MTEKINWSTLISTMAMIVIVRESAVWIMSKLGNPVLGNLVGLGILLIILIIWRRVSGLPEKMIHASTLIMRESAFAFLPVSAGAILMLKNLGGQIPYLVIILFSCTLIPMWIYAKLSKRWLAKGV